MTLQASDLFTVERDGILYNIRNDQMSNLLPGDLLVVERNGVLYRLDGSELLPLEAPVAAGTIVYNNINANRFTEETFDITAGAQTSAKTVVTEIKPYVVGLLSDSSGEFHGLRFDKRRDTWLTRSNIGGSTGLSGTISFWVKPTNAGLNRYVYFDAQPSGYSYSIRIGADSTVIVNDGTANSFTSTDTVIENQWNHIVVSNGGPQAGMYINNVRQPSSVLDLTSGIYSSIGNIYIGAQSSESLEGYLSDFYLIDGVIVEPRYFAEAIEGVWVPKSPDSFVLPQPLSPYETRPNMSQDWSGTGTISNDSLNWSPVFDNNVDTYITGSSGGFQYSDFTFANPPAISESLKVFASARNVGTNTLGIKTDVNSGMVDLPIGFLNTNTNQWSTNVLELSDFAGATELQALRVLYDDGTSGSYLGAVEIDGAMLVDGPANNSQNWSENQDSGVWYSSDNTPDKLFDGDLFTSMVSIANNQLNYVYPNVEAQSSIEVYGASSVAGSSGGPAWVAVVDGTQYTLFDGSATPKWYTIPGLTFPCTLESIGNDYSGSARAIKIDGTILVDAGAQWNTSQDWSTGNNTNYSGAAVNAFDGDLTTAADAISYPGKATTTFGEPIKGSLVEVFIPAAADYDGVIYGINEGLPSEVEHTIVFGVDAGASWITVYSGVEIDVASVFSRRASNSNGSQQVAWRVDGLILVNGNTIGPNGFHLAFDPEASGFKGIGQTNPDTTVDRPISNLFDGTINNVIAAGSGSFSQNVASFPPLTAQSKVEFYRFTAGADSGPYQLMMDDVVVASYTTNSASDGWIQFPGVNYPITFNQLQLNRSGGGTGSECAGIKIDGKIVLEHKGIGKDSNGSLNNFKDNGLAVGNTSQVWSNSLSTDGTFYPGRPAVNAFNGTVENSDIAETQDGSYLLLDISSSPIPITSIEIYGAAGGSPHDVVLNDNPNTATTFTNLSWTTQLVNLDTETELRTLRWGAPMAIVYIKVNGELLIDTNLQDTVLDTPMKNFSVLAWGNNGSLEAAVDTSFSGLSINGTPGTDYYYEEDGAGLIHAGNSNLSIVTGRNYNFGQLPFSDPKATNNGNGTVTIDDTTQDASQDWPSLTTASNLEAATPKEWLFDGRIDVGIRPTGGLTATISWPSGTIQGNVRVHTYETGAPGPLQYKDGTTQLQVGSPNTNGWNDLGSINLTELVFTYPGGSNILFVNAIELDGKILVDPSVSSNGVYQTLVINNASAATSRLYLQYDATGLVTDFTSVDPGFTTISQETDYNESTKTITFPALLPSLETPDEALPQGTSFNADIRVSNTEGTSTATLNEVTPTN